jgi:hypothetical protein
LSGWGTTSYQGYGSRILKATNVTITEQDDATCAAVNLHQHFYLSVIYANPTSFTKNIDVWQCFPFMDFQTNTQTLGKVFLIDALKIGADSKMKKLK